MNRRSTRVRAPRRTLFAAGVLAAALALTGCGDVNPEDLGDLFDQAREAVDEVEDAFDGAQPDSAPDGESEYDQKMGDARDNWESYKEPPPDLEPLEDPYAFHSTNSDGTESATEEFIYGAESAETVEHHYTREYGSEPTQSADGKKTWTDGESTTTVTTNGDHTVSATTTWNKP